MSCAISTAAGASGDGENFISAGCGGLHESIEADELIEHVIFAESGAHQLLSGGCDSASGVAVEQQFDDSIGEQAAVGGRDDESVFTILDDTEYSADTGGDDGSSESHGFQHEDSDPLLE